MFRNYFNLEFRNLKKWMTPNKVLLYGCKLEEAKELDKILSELQIEVEFIQTGISYRDKFKEEDVLSTLENCNLNDFVINPRGYFHIKDMFLLIEDHDLATACLKYLLEFGAPIEK